MAKTTRLTEAAVKIGAAVGRAERAVREAAKVAQKHSEELEKKVNALTGELKKTRKRLKRALAR